MQNTRRQKQTSKIQHFKSEKVNFNFIFLFLNSIYFITFLDAPVKQKLKDKQKIQMAITKSVNQKNEEEMKSRSTSSQSNLSAAQKAVAKHHEKKGQSSKQDSMQTDT